MATERIIIDPSVPADHAAAMRRYHGDEAIRVGKRLPDCDDYMGAAVYRMTDSFGARTTMHVFRSAIGQLIAEW